MNSDRTGIADNISAELARRRLKRADLASVWQVSAVGVSRRLNGSTRITADELVAVADYLGLQVADLLPQEPERASA